MKEIKKLKKQLIKKLGFPWRVSNVNHPYYEEELKITYEIFSNKTATTEELIEIMKILMESNVDFHIHVNRFSNKSDLFEITVEVKWLKINYERM